jgi:hypothetical protein
MASAFRRIVIAAVEGMGAGGASWRRRATILAPPGAVLDDPVEEGSLEADVVPDLLTLDPLVAENLFSLSQKLAVESRLLE